MRVSWCSSQNYIKVNLMDTVPMCSTFMWNLAGVSFFLLEYIPSTLFIQIICLKSVGQPLWKGRIIYSTGGTELSWYIMAKKQRIYGCNIIWLLYPKFETWRIKYAFSVGEKRQRNYFLGIYVRNGSTGEIISVIFKIALNQKLG